MSKEKSAINVFQKYLTVWVILCMVIGILIGEYLPGIPAFLNQFEYAKVSVSYGNPHLAYDLPYDDESGFSKYQKRGEKSKRAVCNMDNKLTH